MAPAKKKATPVDRGPKTAYDVRYLLSHDGDDYAPGDTVELYLDQAKPLLAIGAVSVIPAEKKAEKPDEETK